MTTACPECGSAEIRCEGAPAYHNDGQTDGRYRCGDCGAAFDEPARRERTSQTSANAGTVAATLEGADPDVVPDGGKIVPPDALAALGADR
jgi:DNA-directed RNA polymerase subunit RPC12/RpoP